MDKLLIFDGAMGSELQKHGLDGCPELLNIEKPELIREIHKSYIDAGAGVITANTFGANRFKLEKYGLASRLEEIILGAVKNAKEASDKIYKVALDAGPTGKLLQPYGDTSFEEIYEVYSEVAKAAAKSAADYVILETFSQLGEMRAAYLAMKEHCGLPVICSMTFEENGRTLTGVDPVSFAVTMERMGAYAVGVNCSVGPDKLEGIVAGIKQHVGIPVIVMPNAGLPELVEGKTVYSMGAEAFAGHMEKLVAAGADIVGGCCGTTPEYIRLMSANIAYLNSVREQRLAADSAKKPVIVCSSRKTVSLDNSIKIVGERINPTGRKIMSESIKTGDYEVVYKEAVEQEAAGADILDVNVSVPGTNEVETMQKVVMELQSIVAAPLQIDSANPAVIEQALRLYDGVAIVNSVNAKDESLDAVLPLVKKYGACVIGLTMGADIPKTSEERWTAAQKIIKRAGDYGISKDSIFIDCLTMAASATQEYVEETLKTLGTAKANGIKTALGVSNVSYGLPERKVLNSTFLAMALGYGLNLAIINPMEARMQEVITASRVILNMDSGCKNYIEWADGKKSAAGQNVEKKTAAEHADWTIEECIIKGLKAEALAKLEKQLENMEPFETVDRFIIPGLKEVGRLYEAGSLYLPQLLQSADVVKSMFDKLRQLVDIKVGKGKIVIGTVQGDIHDIGKNIVKVMLQNNGFEVIDLGCDVAPEKFYDAAEKHQAGLVGLSALMTTTIPSMEKTISILKGLECKIVVGGAVLTKQCADEIGADFYAKDAVETVKIADSVLGSK